MPISKGSGTLLACSRIGLSNVNLPARKPSVQVRGAHGHSKQLAITCIWVYNPNCNLPKGPDGGKPMVRRVKAPSYKLLLNPVNFHAP